MERSKPVGICIDDGKRQVVNVVTWEQRKLGDVFDGLQNNTFSRADLNYESGAVKNVHYGDVLIKFGDFIDVSKDELPFITDESQTTKYNSSFLQDAYHKQLIPLMQGIKVTSISKSALQEADMILPKSFEEQAQIGEYFSQIDHLITLHQRKCNWLKNLKEYMLKNIFPRYK